MLHFSLMALALMSTALMSQTNAFEDLMPIRSNSWQDAPVLVLADGRCSTDFDAAYFRSRNINCWYVVYAGTSDFYVKINDLVPWSQSIGRAITGPDAGYTIPQDLWVMGLHNRDPNVAFRKSMTLYRVSCSRNVGKFTTLKRIEYNAAGNITRDVNYPRLPLKVAAPGSPQEAIVLASCNNS